MAEDDRISEVSVSEEESCESFATEDEEAFQKEQYMYAMGQEERKAQEEKAEQQRKLQEREAQSETRREMRRKEEEERLVSLGRRNVIVVIWDGYDEMTAVTIIDVLRAAGVNVVIAAVGNNGLGKDCVPVKSAVGRHGVSLLADVAFETTCNSNFHLFNALVIPGGSNQHIPTSHRKLRSLVKTLSYKEKFICAAGETPFTLLPKCGITKSRAVTGCPPHPGTLPSSTFKSVLDIPVHVDYNVVTCKTAANAIEFALTVIKCIFADEAVAVKTAKELGYEGFAPTLKPE